MKPLNIDEYYSWLWFYMKGPGLCACGAPSDVLELLHGYLARLGGQFAQDSEDYHSSKARDWFLEQTGCEDDETTLQWLFYYWADHMDLIEHGCSIRFSWLTAAGENILEAMDKFGTDLDEIEKQREKGSGNVSLPEWCRK